MTSESTQCRYSMVHVRPGHVVVEHDLLSRSVRSYFSDEPVAPVEEYREGGGSGSTRGPPSRSSSTSRMSRPVRSFLSRDARPDVLRLCEAGKRPAPTRADRPREQHLRLCRGHLRVGRGEHTLLSEEKLRVLNRLFNDRLRTPGKKILILPDLFDLYKTMSYGEIMIDFGLTSMEEER